MKLSNQTDKAAAINFLISLFSKVVETAHPRQLMPSAIGKLNVNRPCLVMGAGKATGAMAAELEKLWVGPLTGLIVVPNGGGLGCQKIEVMEASHPTPNSFSEIAAQRTLALTKTAAVAQNQQLIFLISGGASSLLAMPSAGISLADKQNITTALLKSGATIGEINCVRKHLSLIKGGRLAQAAWPAEIITLAISDVPGDEPSVIGSGPTVPDPSTCEEAIAVLAQYAISTPPSVVKHLHTKEAETPKPGVYWDRRQKYEILATPQTAIQSALDWAKCQGVHCLYLGVDIEDEARDLAQTHARLAMAIASRQKPVKIPCVIISGGETCVRVTGGGQGGRNGEYLMTMLNTLRGHPGIYALAADTDGIDGSGNNAGALLSPDSYFRSEKMGLDIAHLMRHNDSYRLFARLNDLLITGPTRTNVNDFRAVLILPS